MSAVKCFSKTRRRKLLVCLGTVLLSVRSGLGVAEGLSVVDFWECLLQAFALVGSPKALHISTYTGWQSSDHIKKTKKQNQNKANDIDNVQITGIYRHSGSVHKSVVQMF